MLSVDKEFKTPQDYCCKKKCWAVKLIILLLKNCIKMCGPLKEAAGTGCRSMGHTNLILPYYERVLIAQVL